MTLPSHTAQRREEQEPRVTFICVATHYATRVEACLEEEGQTGTTWVPGFCCRPSNGFPFRAAEIHRLMYRYLLGASRVCLCSYGSVCHSPGSRVVLGPNPYVLVQVMRPQNRRVSGQILKVVHDDGHEQVQHLRRSRRQTFAPVSTSSTVKEGSLKTVLVI